jgi:hypothetical protein
VKFFVYQNWTHKRAIVHKNSCVYCNDGKGMFPNKPYSEKNGKWSSSFTKYSEAKKLALETRMKDIHDCRVCFKIQKA